MNLNGGIIKEREQSPEKEKESINYIQSFSEKWKESSLPEGRLFLEKIIKKIIIRGEEIEIVWTF